MSTIYDRDVTSRERFHRVMAGQPVDRPPLWDDGIREDVMDKWAALGHPVATLDDFIIDRREQLSPNIYHREFDLCGDSERHPDTPPDDPRRLAENWRELAGRPDDRDYVLGLGVSEGLFLTLGVQAWDSLSRLLYRMADHPALTALTMQRAAEFTIEVIDQVLIEAEPDYILFSEPIASNTAPVVGPATFAEMCGAAYSSIITHARERGVRWVILQSYGNAAPLIGPALSMGVDAYWGGDTEAGSTRYLDLRGQYGTRLALIGGIDIGLLATDSITMDKALSRTVPRLLADGRYVPLLDGRVRGTVAWEKYVHYRRTLESIVLSV
jgi:hypothetical protein